MANKKWAEFFQQKGLRDKQIGYRVEDLSRKDYDTKLSDRDFCSLSSIASEKVYNIE